MASLAQLRAATYKRRDSWWTVLLVDPLAIHVVRLADRWRWVTPNRVTGLSFLVGLVAAAEFLRASPGALLAGAVLYHLAFVLDCVDGKLARWRRCGSAIGGWLDFALDQIRMVVCSVALLAGQYRATGRDAFLLLAAIVVFLHMFRYFNGDLMRQALLTGQAMATPARADHARPESPDDDTATADDVGPVEPADWAGPRAWLARRRIRANLFGGIEFQMALLIVGPLAGAGSGFGAGSGSGFGAGAGFWAGFWAGSGGPTTATADRIATAVLVVTVVASALLVGFELAQIARFLRAAAPRPADATGARAAVDASDVSVPRPVGATEAPPA